MKIKGSGVISIQKYVEKHYPDRLNEWLEALPETTRKIHSEPILATGMYELYPAIIEPTSVACRLFHPGNEERGAWEMGMFSAEYALRGFYRIFVRIGSPNFTIKRAPRVFSSYYEDSRLAVVEDSANRTVMRIIEFKEPYRILDLRIGGWMEQAVLVSGGKNPKVEITRSLVDGDPYTEYVAVWD